MANELADLVSETRFREIHEERERVKQQHRRVLDGLYFGPLTEEGANQILRDTIETYLHEVREVLKPPEKETVPTGEDYWTDVEVTTLELPNGEAYDLTGLESLFDLPGTITVEETVEREEYPRGKVTETDTREVGIPRKTLLDYYYTANKGLAEAGVKFDAEAGKMPTYGFEELEGYEPENKDRTVVVIPDGEEGDNEQPA